MKQYLSVLILMARSSIYKIVGLLLLMTAVEGGLFYHVLKSGVRDVHIVFDDSRIALVFLISSMVIVQVLYLSCSDLGSKQGNILGRLSVSTHHVFLLQGAYNAIVLFLVWAAQLFIALALCQLYLSTVDPALVNGQSLFLLVYHNDFLANLLPLGHWLRYGRNIIFLAAVAFFIATQTLPARRGRRNAPAWAICAPLTTFHAPAGYTEGDLWTIVLSLACLILSILYATMRGEDDDDEA